VILAQLSADSGVPLRDILLGIIGTALLVLIAVRALAAFVDERYGKIVMMLLAAVPVAGLCYFPDRAMDLLKGLFLSAFGAG
jgi:hypothetical protein